MHVITERGALLLCNCCIIITYAIVMSLYHGNVFVPTRFFIVD